MKHSADRFDEDEEDAIVKLMEKGHAVAVFSQADLGPVDRQAFMEFLFACGFGALKEVEKGVRCPECMGLHDEDDKEVH